MRCCQVMSKSALLRLGLLIVVVLVGATWTWAQPAGVAASSQPASTATAQPPPPEITLWEMIRMAGFFIYPLLAASVLCVALVIERFIALRRSNVNPSGFLPGLQAVYRDVRSDREAALQYCERSDTSIARMISAGIRRLPRGQAVAEKAIEDAGANEALKLRKNLRFLYAIGSVGTLLGLIGTIMGMIRAFQVASTGGMGQAERLSKGIYEAMVNTFAGLAVAIVATFFYYWFVGRVEKLISDMNDTLTEFARKYTDELEVEEPLATSAGAL